MQETMEAKKLGSDTAQNCVCGTVLIWIKHQLHFPCQSSELP